MINSMFIGLCIAIIIGLTTDYKIKDWRWWVLSFSYILITAIIRWEAK